MSTISGDDRDNFLVGTPGPDLIYGFGGNDIIVGLAGDDNLLGLEGNDQVFGNEGNDFLYGGSGDDFLIGASGDDILYADAGSVPFPDAGNDHLDGGNGNDQLSGGQRNDVLLGGSGNDILSGGDGDDFVSGGSGDDTISGEETILLGPPGIPIPGGGGNDLLTAGAGNDIFLFVPRPDGIGHDTVQDFQSGDDKIELRNFDLAFDDVDTNRNGFLDDGDDCVSTAAGITIDLACATGDVQAGTITVFGTTQLASNDILFTTEDAAALTSGVSRGAIADDLWLG